MLDLNKKCHYENWLQNLTPPTENEIIDENA